MADELERRWQYLAQGMNFLCRMFYASDCFGTTRAFAQLSVITA
jgi:hypothetical protein